MVPGKHDILRALELSPQVVDYKEIPGVLHRRDLGGVHVTYAPGMHDPTMNHVGSARFESGTVEAGITRVVDFFSQLGLPFAWLTTPLDQPPDLAQRLAARGFRQFIDADGLWLPLDALSAAGPASLEIRPESGERLAAVYAQAFPMPRESADLMVAAGGALDNVENFVAYLDGAAVAVATSMYLAKLGMVHLGGAATLPAYRGRGIYTALLAERFRAAREQGYHTAVVMADKTSSAPICRKLGFKKVCDIAIWSLSDVGHQA